MAPLPLTIDGTRFRDSRGREFTLHGINVAADAKFPRLPDQPSHEPKNFFDGDGVSFVGQPFTEQEARTHFARLRLWGYNAIRYIFTWEALEHAGPGKYDEDFIAHTIKILRIAKQYDFHVFMDPHQDVWSRFTGGSGAPLWTVYACGFDPETFSVNQAAVVHNTFPEPAEYPKMIWTTNYSRLATETIFTLFYAGRDFAPNAIINGQNIQDYLTDHFINACKHLALRIHEAGDLEDDCIIGWESMNEPHHGLIGWEDLTSLPEVLKMRKGTCPTPWQSMLTGAGRAVEIDTYAFGNFGPYKSGRELVDPKGLPAWLTSDRFDIKYGWKRDPGWKLGQCIWAQQGVWDPKEDTLLQKDYFSRIPASGKKLNDRGFANIYYLNHFRKYRDAIRSVHQNCMILLQSAVLQIPPSIKGTKDDDDRLVFVSHYYDGLTLITKHWNRIYNVDIFGVMRGRYLSPVFAVKFGETAIRNCLRDQLEAIRLEGIEYTGVHPSLFTEIGIPFDMDDKKAYKTGDYRSQIAAMDANHFALEGSGVNGFTLWTYTRENNHKWGDFWNGEDLSIYSIDDKELPVVNASIPPSANTSTTSLLKHASSVNPSNLKEHVKQPQISQQPLGSSPDLSNNPGYRAAEAFIRPCPLHTAGDVVRYGFDLQKCTFTFTLTAKFSTTEDLMTEIFLPEYHFPPGNFSVEVSSGKWTISEQNLGGGCLQIMKWWHDEGEQDITVRGVVRKFGSVEGNADEDPGYYETIRRLATNCTIM